MVLAIYLILALVFCSKSNGKATIATAEKATPKSKYINRQDHQN